MLLLTEDTLLPPADRLGARSHCYRLRKMEPYAASESSSFPNLGYEIDRYLGPGEIVRLHQRGGTDAQT